MPRIGFIRLLCMAALSGLGGGMLSGCEDSQPSAAEKPLHGSNAALSVSLITPSIKPWSDRISATGNIEAWQLMSIGAEVNGVRIVDVLVNVGDSVSKGQLLARLEDASLRVELIAQQAALAEVRANLAQAEVYLVRLKKLNGIQVVSEQELLQSETAATTNAAKVAVVEAQIAGLQLKLRNTRIVAPDDGIVAARNASVGALVEGSSDLFKLIRHGRVEWRAELRPEQQAKVAIGQGVRLRDPLGRLVDGRVRQIAPTADQTSRTSLVYVDVLSNELLKPGVLATGEFVLSSRDALTVPYASVLLRDGFNYVMTVSAEGLVKPRKIDVGDRRGNDVEILAGLTPEHQIIASGVSFLHAGDRVRVISAPEDPAMKQTSAAAITAEAPGQP